MVADSATTEKFGLEVGAERHAPNFWDRKFFGRKIEKKKAERQS